MFERGAADLLLKFRRSEYEVSQVLKIFLLVKQVFAHEISTKHNGEHKPIS